MKEYIPSLLRNVSPLQECRYGIGIIREEGVGMIHGPFPYEMDCLEIPGEGGHKIFEFINGTSDIIWRWRNGKWVSKEQRFPAPLRTPTTTKMLDIDIFSPGEDDLPF